jgi:hypothetical protein
MPKRSSRPTDPIKSAKYVLDEIIAKHDPDSITLEKVKEAEACGKNLAAVALGRLGTTIRSLIINCHIKWRRRGGNCGGRLIR